MAGKASDKTTRAILLKGDDDFLKQRHFEKLLAEYVAPDFADFDLEYLEGNNVTSDQIIAGLSIPPFSSRRRVVVVKYANKIPEDQQQKLAGILKSAPSTGLLILVNPATDKVDGKPKKGSEVIGDLSKAVRAIGEVKEFGGGTKKQQQEQVRSFIQEQLIKYGKKMDSTAIALFMQRTGSDLAIASSELSKVVDYAGDSTKITAEDVAAVTSESPEEKIFKFLDAVAAKNRPEALKLISQLFQDSDDARSEAPKALSNIARQFRLIWQMKLLQEAGTRTMDKASVPDEIKNRLPSEPNILDLISRQAWQGEKLARQARSFSLPELVNAFNAIARTDSVLKGIEGNIEDPELAMELLVLDLCGKG